MSLRFVFSIVLATWLAGFAVVAGHAAAVNFKIVGTLGAPASGQYPTGVVMAGDGNLYGTTSAGGSGNAGTVFRLTPTGTLTTIYSFSGGADGGAPMGVLALGNDGNLYGATINGGANSDGTFFRITTAGALATLHSFNPATEGSGPAKLVKGTDGNFYSIAPTVSPVQGGIFLKITITGAVTVLHNFVPASEGVNPNYEIVQGSDGAFYGSTTMQGPSGYGVVFRCTTAGAFSVLGNNANLADPPFFKALGNDGKIYGYFEGNNSSIFKMTNEGVMTTIHTFASGSDGENPRNLIKGADGNLYGTGGGGANGYGVLFKVDSSGQVTTISSFTPAVWGFSDLIQVSDGNFYALGSSSGVPVVGKISPTGIVSGIYTFTPGQADPRAPLLQGADGNFYGTTIDGGVTNGGTLFEMSPSGTVTTLFSFDANTTGWIPITPVVQDPFTSHLFMSTSQGGPAGAVNSEGGTIVEGAVVKGLWGAADTFAVVNDFTQAAHQRSGPVNMIKSNITGAQVSTIAFTNAEGPSSPPLFYACSDVGGLSEGGVLYTGEEDGTVGDLFTFPTSTSGTGPQGPLVQDRAGNYYGVTPRSGTGNVGTVFKITPAVGGTLSTLTTLHNFQGSNGPSAPFADPNDAAAPGTSCLVMGSNGIMYGTTKTGGAYGYGTIFSITTDGTEAVLHSFNPNDGTAHPDGGTPLGGLIQASDGNFYGTTSAGGDAGDGILFSLTPGGVMTEVLSFGGIDTAGVRPSAGLIQANDGGLYGVGNAGQAATGVVFRVGLNEGTQAQTIQFPAQPLQHAGTPLVLNATATSGLPVNYLVSGPATILGNTLTFLGPGTVTVTAGAPGNGVYAPAAEVTQAIRVSGQPGVSFGQWGAGLGGGGSATSCPSGDAVPNLLKYVCDINPGQAISAADRGALPTLGMDTTSNPGTDYLTLTYRQSASMAGVVVNVEVSTDMETWTPVVPDIAKSVGTEGNDTIMEVGVNASGASKKFMRLNLTMP
jgi:uncharacterized repeat protein (TIGR03803 family)